MIPISVPVVKMEEAVFSLSLQHRIWRACKLRVHTVAEQLDNSVAVKANLQALLQQVRIVRVIRYADWSPAESMRKWWYWFLVVWLATVVVQTAYNSTTPVTLPSVRIPFAASQHLLGLPFADCTRFQLYVSRISCASHSATPFQLLGR